MALSIEPMQHSDWSDVRRIYAEGLATGLAAFMHQPPLWKDWDVGHLRLGRVVARDGSDVIGWAALAPVTDS